MAALPSYVKLLRDSAGEEFDPGVVVSDMEKGLAKMRRSASRVVVSVSATLFFKKRQDTIDFETWYFETIKQIGWFDWKDPRTNTVRSVRFKSGSIGQLQPLAQRYGYAKRAVTLEYLR